ncbi:hypothetical protein BGY98DRAFT_1101233 [Russula aff. rugulosa BPL654]|nr:hypothetical protein BGY98DRAFT_1101233 [Russula aff. rugulosa BPL654]
MDVFEADYSNLFAAGLRGIQSRSTDPDRSPQPDISSSIGAGSADRDQDVKHVKGPSVPSFWKSFLLSTRLWRLPSRFPRAEMSSSAVRNLKSWTNAVSKASRRQSIPSHVVEESSLKLRILDWSSHVSNALGTLDEEDEYVDPDLFDEVDPVDVPESTPTTKILLTLPSSVSLGEQEISSALEQHDYRMSLQALPVHMMLPSLRYRSFFSSDDETTWETASASSSEDESGLEDDWDQFRVEWIDFDGAH